MNPLPEVAGDPGAATSLVGAALRIAGVLLLLCGCAWAWLHWQRRSGKGSRRELKILDQAHFNRSASVALINASGHRFLLGISADGVRLITDLGNAAESEAAPRFGSVLREVSGAKEASK
jgi:flagellar biogenesis protein FliO